MTREWADQADPDRRRSFGQYMTPRSIREELIDRLDLFPGMRVLDPGVGTGEFLAAVRERVPSARLTGWDIDSAAIDFAVRQVSSAELEVRSAFDRYQGEPFDLVIGNPPYLQFRASPEIRERFAPVISGRPNAFALFFQAAIAATRPGGQVAFVVPPSMNNGAYFEALRNFIVAHAAIEHLEVLEGSRRFEDATTAAQLIVVRVGAESPRFHLRRRCREGAFTRTIFSTDPDRLEREFKGRSSLWELGYEAFTGPVVWNRHRDRLRREPGPQTVPLIWSHNVGRGELRLDDGHRKPQHIAAADLRTLTGPAIVVNRVVGAVGRGELKAAPVPDGLSFLAENHINVIRPRVGVETRFDWQELLAVLSSPEVPGRVRLLTGNTQISATELTHLLPLDLVPGA